MLKSESTVFAFLLHCIHIHIETSLELYSDKTESKWSAKSGVILQKERR